MWRKPKIVIPKGINKPVGEHSSKHATQIGVLIRLEAPMQVEGWAKIPNEKKEDLFRKLVNKLSYEVEERHVAHCIWKSFAKQYSTFRSNAHTYFLKIKAEGGVALAKQSVYEKLATRPDDWLWLCDFWETEKFQTQMKKFREEQKVLPDGVARMSAEEICIKVLGEDSLYAKSKRLAKKGPSHYSTSYSEASANNARLEEELVATQEELASTKAELALQKNKIEAVVKCVEKITGKSVYEIIDLPD